MLTIALSFGDTPWANQTNWICMYLSSFRPKALSSTAAMNSLRSFTPTQLERITHTSTRLYYISLLVPPPSSSPTLLFAPLKRWRSACRQLFLRLPKGPSMVSPLSPARKALQGQYLYYSINLVAYLTTLDYTKGCIHCGAVKFPIQWWRLVSSIAKYVCLTGVLVRIFRNRCRDDLQVSAWFKERLFKGSSNRRIFYWRLHCWYSLCYH